MATHPTERWTPSTIIQGTMALSSLAAIIFLAVTLQEIPDILTAVVMAIIGFYFGQAIAHRQASPPE